MVAHVMIHLKPEDLPEAGLRVKYRCGELFEKQIEWTEVIEGVLQTELSTNDLNETGINIAGAGTPGYAGFEPRTGNYWRYKHEADPDVFREQCMQIIEIQEPFSPRSSWEAWWPTESSITQDRLKIILKNAVTGTRLRYEMLSKGFSYQIKDLSKGRKSQKTLTHDYILNQMLGTSFKKLDHHHTEINTEPNSDAEAGGCFSIHFQNEHYLIQYQISEQVFSLTLFDTKETKRALLKRVDLPHSEVIEDTRTFLG